MQIHPFVRYVGTEYAVIVEDRTLFYEHRDSVSAINRFLNNLEYTIEASEIPRPKLMSDVYQIRDEVYYLLRRLYDCIQIVSPTSLDTVKRAVDSKLGKFTKRDILELCPNLSASSVERHLKKLVADGYIAKIGAGKSTMYVKS